MTYSTETAHSINGVSGRLYARHVRPDRTDLFSAQKWVSERRRLKAKGYPANAEIQAEIRFDDSCKNGHATFAITGDISAPSKSGRRDELAGGCLHDEIAKAFPELAHLIKWHLCSTDGPMSYVGNTIYLAGDRDHHGLRKGESRQIINGRTKQPCWELAAVNSAGVLISDTKTGDEYRDAETVPLFILDKNFNGDESDLPPAPLLKWVPSLRHGEGKERNLDGARRTAVWPDATDAELSGNPTILKVTLEARLPALLEAFLADMVAIGLEWSPIVKGGE